MSEALLRALREDPRREAAHPLLKEFYAAALEHLEQLQKRGAVDYLASPRGGDQLVVQLSPEQIAQLAELAAAVDVSQRRVLYTAVVLYARTLGLQV